jgi:hypothetical protein
VNVAEADFDAVLNSIQAAMDAVPKLTCRKCKEPKHPVLFQPSQQKLGWPICRVCKNVPRGLTK